MIHQLDIALKLRKKRISNVLLVHMKYSSKNIFLVRELKKMPQKVFF